MEIPVWLPIEEWEAFIDMRKKMGSKHKATEYAQQLLIKRLDGFRNQGMDVKGIIEQSIMRSWTGLFPVHADLKQTAFEQTSFDPMLKTQKLLESYDRVSKPEKISSGREAFLQVKSQLRH